MQKVNTRTKSKTVADFGERMSTAAAAKQALLEKWRANKVDVNDPAYLEQQAARQAAAAARAERDAQRKAEKDAAKAKALADQLAALEAAKVPCGPINDFAEEEARIAAEAEAAAALVAMEEQRKAARDARYAARKARK